MSPSIRMGAAGKKGTSAGGRAGGAGQDVVEPTICAQSLSSVVRASACTAEMAAWRV